ncbi:MAG: hypothetical protein PHQ03_12930 [Methylococcales bacterium]|nr:hypothetical protein [Methylococcales bacterium]
MQIFLLTGLTADTRDVITDFVHSDGNKVNFRGIDANTSATGIQGFTYINTATFSAAGQIRFNPSTNMLAFKQIFHSPSQVLQPSSYLTFFSNIF